jgi:hypothetical protein
MEAASLSSSRVLKGGGGGKWKPPEPEIVSKETYSIPEEPMSCSGKYCSHWQLRREIRGQRFVARRKCPCTFMQLGSIVRATPVRSASGMPRFGKSQKNLPSCFHAVGHCGAEASEKGISGVACEINPNHASAPLPSGDGGIQSYGASEGPRTKNSLNLNHDRVSTASDRNRALSHRF